MNVKICLKLCLPVIFSYIPLGMSFGILASSNDFSMLEVICISFFVYSGSAEFLLITFITAKQGLLSIFVTLFLLGFRHFFYTLSLLERLKGLNFLRHYVIFTLSDESFALLSTNEKGFESVQDKNKKSLYYALLCFINQASWVLGGILGVLVQKMMKFDYKGIEFCLIALFIVLSYDAFKLNPNKKVFILAAMIGICGFLFIAKAYMLFICLTFALILLVLGKRYV
ncbi:branched-chain amino acid permease [Campylobacter sp. MIT 97-5078]|uniref:AzlC family ABC transporter permease n=1 Tax=Campylobacter sp. MIT 97-5078 TaxID=1548153 RepID=UPI000513E46D|nr:AzlC family ABC transporter permease [Campylobacter sp. MIT 97-5078]KGI56971.1 hypothetical protein LR59_03815 [Campylobacter sp. MIT 97-5078]TQR28198.1 branched-chain amino acid permease [Campylobacter sp. MIT 97-5078]